MTDRQHQHTSDEMITPSQSHQCAECGEDFAVPLPERLVEDCASGRLLLFVGSGASTESHNVMPWTFYDEIADGLGLTDSGLPFPDLMTAFVEKHSRQELISAFIQRMRYIDRFPHLRRKATRFHRSLGANPFFREVITTNWDDYFETEASALSLVYGSDFDYWDLWQRKVLKLHGSILNPGSVVATRSEYDSSVEALRTGALGGTVRHLLATRSVVFVGYSLRDDDVRTMIEVLRSDLSTAARPCYFVHPSSSFDVPIPEATVISTSAAMFLELLDDALVESGTLLPLAMYDRISKIRQRWIEARDRVRERLSPTRHPLSIYCFAFQDGFGDALDRIEADHREGECRKYHELIHSAAGYVEAGRRAVKARNYWDASYIEGYGIALAAVADEEWPLRDIPLYFCPGLGAAGSFKIVATAVRAGEAGHRAAFRWARRQTRDLPKGLVVTHTPFLPAY